MGIGNELRSDDAAGMHVSRTLRKRRCAVDLSRLLIVDGGLAPENVAGDLRDFKPDLVIFVDAAVMGERPGTIRWISTDEIDGMSSSTHSLPLSMLSSYLSLELGCEIALLGIQPASIELGEGISLPVHQAVTAVVDALYETLFTGAASPYSSSFGSP